MDVVRDRLEYDVAIIGAGPAGLAAAIRLKQRAPQLSVCVLEKGAEVGSHLLSGAAFDPCALDELLPDWRARAPAFTPVSREKICWLTKKRSFRLPNWLTPPMTRQTGCVMGSLGEMCRWLAAEAEALGVDVLPGFAAVDVLMDGERVQGVLTGDLGLGKDEKLRSDFQPGVVIHARWTLLAEGARGSLTRILEEKLGLRPTPQAYALGLKERWRLRAGAAPAGTLIHTLGWPLPDRIGGGGFVYVMEDGTASVGLTVHLDHDPADVFARFQTFKTHPHIAALLEGGECLGFGARVINEGGWQSLPKMTFPGGALIGCAAGLVDLPRVKGIHTAMQSGMLAAECIANELAGKGSLADFDQRLRESSVGVTLRRVRNVKPLLSRFGTRLGLMLAGSLLWLENLGVPWPWTYRNQIRQSQACDGPPLPRSESLLLANIAHEDDQPCHLRVGAGAQFDIRICPAGVYEVGSVPQHPGNCLHCKACDAVCESIRWTPPAGGSGPNYVNL